VTVTGTATGGDVKLSLTFVATGGAIVPPRTETFEGRLIGADVLTGTVSGSDAVPVTYRRVR